MLLFSFLSEPLMLFAWLAAMAISLTLHEFAHALSAYLQGDSTAKYSGRLSLNPLRHLDLWGTLMLFLIGFGWGKPVPFNPYNLKNQKWGPALVAVSGPFANLFLLIFFGLTAKLLVGAGILDPSNMLYIFMEMIVILNAVWMTFNLIPLPPLDGSKILFAILPSRFEHWKIFLETRGSFLLLALIILDRLAGISFLSLFFGGVIKMVSRIFGLSLG